MIDKISLYCTFPEVLMQAVGELFDRIVKINTVNLIPSVGVVLLFHVLLGE